MAVCTIAAVRGRNEERLAAGGMLAAWALTMVVYRTQGQQTEWGILIIDLALLGLLVGIALRSSRYWPLFAAGFHLLAVVTHVARSVDSSVTGWAYITAGIIWGYLVVFAVGYGAWTAPRRGQANAPTPAGATRR